ESHVDKSYGLVAAAELIAELHEFEEVDEGLWQGLKPKEAISTIAAYTYGGSVLSIMMQYMEDIDEDRGMRSLIEEFGEDEFNDDHDPEAFKERFKQHILRIVDAR